MTHILVVEDSPIIQMATKLIFKSFDCVVDFAKTGKETLNLLKKNHYDIVLLDLGLPDMSGIELVKKIRKNKAYSKIKLVALTAHRSEEYKEICLKAGMDGFYTKPLTPENISELLTNLNLFE